MRDIMNGLRGFNYKTIKKFFELVGGDLFKTFESSELGIRQRISYTYLIAY